jgi:hypothetical protein
MRPRVLRGEFAVGAGIKPDSDGSKPDSEMDQNRICGFRCRNRLMTRGLVIYRLPPAGHCSAASSRQQVPVRQTLGPLAASAKLPDVGGWPPTSGSQVW